MSSLEKLNAEIRDIPADHLRRIIRCYHMDYARALEALHCARWLFVTQFALWCVWLA